MPITRPRDVIEAINRIYPAELDGTGLIPLSEQNLADLRTIFDLAGQIPRELLRKGDDAEAFTESMAVMQSRLMNAVSGDGTFEPPGLSHAGALQGMPAFGGRNPLAVLRDVLSRCPNFTPKEIRRRLVQLIADFESAGTTPFPDTSAIGPMNLTLSEIRRHMENCEYEGSITLEHSTSGCSARLTAAGRIALEEPDAAMVAGSHRTVFISCGQFTESEIALGKALARLVDEPTPCKGYFAQNQSSLEGLSRHVFGALNSCAGFVAVMHHRGKVQTLNSLQIRASVWIEQEIAIAAFLSQAQGRALPSAVYIQEGIALEGARQQLLLGPIFFKDNAEVIEEFRRRLQGGLFGASAGAKASEEALADIAEDRIRQVLAATGGNKTKAAQILGIERKTLYRKLDRMRL